MLVGEGKNAKYVKGRLLPRSLRTASLYVCVSPLVALRSVHRAVYGRTRCADTATQTRLPDGTASALQSVVTVLDGVSSAGLDHLEGFEKLVDSLCSILHAAASTTKDYCTLPC